MVIGVLVAQFLVFIAKLCDLPQKYAAWLLTTLGRMYKDYSSEIREKHLKQIANIESCNPAYKKEGIFKLLEIGTGPGVNFKFYPKNAQVIATDPNPYFQESFKKNRSDHPDVNVLDTIVAKAEDLSMIGDNSIDVVVSTNVMCSVEKVPVALKEIKRILAPGGKFVYWEHCGDRSGSWLRTAQNMVNMVWPYFVDGCNINRDFGDDIKNAGFTEVDNELVYIQTQGSLLMRLLQSHVKGTATK